MTQRTRKLESRPLIEHIEGTEADNRASLWAAWVRQSEYRKLQVTNLHVRELLLYILATDRDGRGVRLTYDEIATRLECPRVTARRVVDRACNEYRMLAVMEDRYVDGGQTANRYSIDWQNIRAINQGLIGKNTTPPGSRPGALSDHPPALSDHPPALSDHPYKETPELNSRTLLSGLSGCPERRISESALGDEPEEPEEPPMKAPARLVDDSQVAGRVSTLFDRIAYRGQQGWTLWLAIAAVDAGLLSEADVGGAMVACTTAKERPRDPVRYFRRCLAQKAGISSDELTQRLRAVRIRWNHHEPGTRPKPPSKDASVDAAVCRAPPPRSAAASEANIHIRRIEVLAKLAEIDQSDRRGVNH